MSLIRPDMISRVLRAFVSIFVSWIVTILALLVWMQVGNSSSNHLLSFIVLSGVALTICYWFTYYLAFVLLHLTLNAYRPRWASLVVGTFVGPLSWGFLVMCVGGGFFSRLRPDRGNLAAYAIFMLQGLTAAMCYVAFRDVKRVERGFGVSGSDAEKIEASSLSKNSEYPRSEATGRRW